MKEPKGIDKRSRKYRKYKEWKDAVMKGGEEVAKQNLININELPPKSNEDLVYDIGLGDTIEAVLEVTGVKAIVNLFTDECGCKERKEKLNKAFPYRRKAQRCLTQQQYEQYKLYTKTRTLDVWNESEIHFVIKLYAWVFAIQYNANDLCRSCAGSGKLLLIMSKDLDKVFISYQKDLQDLKMK